MDIRPPSAREHCPPNNGEIKSLQYGRGIAALFVCLFHYEGIKNQIQAGESAALGSTNFDFIFRAGHSGVEFFFILSGFIIFQAHRSDLTRPDLLGSFYLKRAIRILPMFWLIMIPYGLAVLVISSHSTLTPGTFLLDTLLIPREGLLTLPAAWTLQHELVFYLLFGFLIANQRLGMIALVLWQMACLIVLVFDLLPQDYLVPATTFFGFYNFGFLFGIVIALLRDRVDFGAYPRGLAVFGGIGSVGLVVCFVGEWRFGNAFFSSPAASTLTYFGLYSLVILALLSVENKPRPFLDATLGTLGAASYIIYVIHEPLYSVLDKIFRFSTPRSLAAATTTFLLAVGVVVAISLLMHYGIERATLRGLRRRLLPGARATKDSLNEIMESTADAEN
jgi:peptidoglycan/LPS O-acetylase OafA/YrhL